MPLTLAVLKAATLAVLLQLPPHWSDRDELPADRGARLDGIADDIAFAALERPPGWSAVGLAAGLLNIGERESHWARYVGAGCTVRPRNPDTGKLAPDCDHGRAHTYWQLWNVACPALVKETPGSRSEQVVATRCAIAHFIRSFKRCSAVDADELVGAYAGYRSMCFIVADTRDRAKTHARYRDRLRVALQQR